VGKGSVRGEVCRVCHWAPVYAKGRCAPCYMFRRRHRRDRTEAEVVAYGLRIQGQETRRRPLTA